MKPTAIAEAPYRVLLFYKFAAVPNPALLRQEQIYLCTRLGLKGRIIVAAEGINGTLSGPAAQTQAYQDFMTHHPLFAHIEFKVDASVGDAFRKLHVRVKNEIVRLGAELPVDTVRDTAPFIEPKEMQQLLREQPSDVVILDTRSSYEYEIGRFRGARTLPIDNFHELPGKLDELAALKDKKVVTYCTGGIRCEKLTAYLKQKGFKHLYQLHGGIIRYAKETGGENFDGQCYVFDERIAVPVNTVNPTIIGNCKACGSATEHMVNCANADCNAQVLLCTTCAEAHEGSCSEACKAAPRRRAYNGKGQYYRGLDSKNYVATPEPLEAHSPCVRHAEQPYEAVALPL